jgi:hypothetical protein
MKFLMACLVVCLLAAGSPAQDHFATQRAQDDAGLAIVLQLNAEQEAAEQQQRIEVYQYNPEATVLAGIRPSPPTLSSSAHITDADVEALQRYGNAADQYDAQRRSAVERENRRREQISNQQEQQERLAEIEKRKLAELERQNELLRQQIEEQKRATFEHAVKEWQVATVREYPDAGIQNSPLWRKMIEIADQMEARKDDQVYAANAPFVIAKMAAEQIGIKPVSATQPAASP